MINLITLIQSLNLQQKVSFKLRLRITNLWIMDSHTSPYLITLSEYVKSTTSILLQAKNDANNPLDYGFMYKPICNHPFRICSKYNINFTSLIVDCFDIANMRIELIENECYFAGDNVMSIKNSKKRNPLYWWFDTNVYSIFGKYNRKKLPDCLVYAIRKCDRQC